ncbi:MAG TPA: M23 family metallopeptidase [Rhodocyclaceae bacterium]|nr:M23 family metallopeptidase [Rhodocyclaceae bacterium]
MQIIVVSRHLKTAKTLNIMPRHLVFAVFAFIGIVIVSSAGFSWLSMHLRLPIVQDLVAFMQQKERAQTQEVVHNNLQLMATRLGELQAKVLQLDTLGDRLSSLAGVKRESAEKPQISVPPAQAQAPTPVPGQGGPFVSAPLQYNDLQGDIERLGRIVGTQLDEMALLEYSLLEKRVRERLLPTTLPVKGVQLGSGFGFRSDPLVGSRAMHEGLDFAADTGTPVVAAAAGMVIVATYHPEFGNMIDVDHGDGLTSRYAHLSRMDVKEGQMIKRGERIGAVGTTGRSTGPHLHFEVRMFGVAQNPAVFLRQGTEFASLKSK